MRKIRFLKNLRMFKVEVSVYNIQFHNLRVEARKVNTFRRLRTSLELSQQERRGEWLWPESLTWLSLQWREFKVSAQDAPWPRDVKTDRRDFACFLPPCGLLKLGSCLEGIWFYADTCLKSETLLFRLPYGNVL